MPYIYCPLIGISVWVLTQHLEISVSLVWKHLRNIGEQGDYNQPFHADRPHFSPAFFLNRILTRLLEVSDDPQVIAVAAHDIGEYVRHYPRGKR